MELALDDRRSLSEAQIAELRAAFVKFDKDSDGHISTNELGSLLRSLGHNPKQREVENMINEVDVDGNGTIDFTELLSLMAVRNTGGDSQDELLEAFRSFDVEGHGSISEEHFRKVMTTLGEKLSHEEVSAIVDQIRYARSVYTDGTINYIEFTKLLMTR